MADDPYKEAYNKQQETINKIKKRNAEYTKILEDEILDGNRRLEKAIEDYENQLEKKEQVIHRQLQKAEVTKDKQELETTLAHLKKKCTEETGVLGNKVNELADRLSDQQEKNTQLVRQLEEASEQGVGKSATGPGQFDYPRLLSTANKEISELSKQNQDLVDDVNALQAKLEILKIRETDLKGFYAAVKDVPGAKELMDLYDKTFGDITVRGGDSYFDPINNQ